MFKHLEELVANLYENNFNDVKVIKLPENVRLNLIVDGNNDKHIMISLAEK